MVKRGPMSGTFAGPRTGPDSALELAFAGKLPNSIYELDRWTLLSPWTILHNYSSATVGPSACAAASGSSTLNLIKLGSGTTSTLASAGQSKFVRQTGFVVNTNQDFLYAGLSSTWKFSATVPTAYLVTLKFAGTPTSGQYLFGGLDGVNGGWAIEAHATSGIRAAIGSGSGYVNTSYVGGTSLYDGKYHTIMLVIDDAGGKAKIYTEFANTESTGLTISSGNAYPTIGPNSAGSTWGTAVTYLLTARGEHASLYTSAQDVFDKYEGARLRGGA